MLGTLTQNPSKNHTIHPRPVVRFVNPSATQSPTLAQAQFGPWILWNLGCGAAFILLGRAVSRIWSLYNSRETLQTYETLAWSCVKAEQLLGFCWFTQPVATNSPRSNTEFISTATKPQINPILPRATIGFKWEPHPACAAQNALTYFQ